MTDDHEISKKLAAILAPNGSFNDRGQFDPVGGPLEDGLVEEPSLEMAGEQRTHSQRITVGGAVLERRLWITFFFNVNVHATTTIDVSARRFTEAIRELIQH